MLDQYMLNYKHQTNTKGCVVMKRLKKICIEILCQAGKYGVNKSTVAGIYEFDVPKELKCCAENEHGQCNGLNVRQKKNSAD